MCGFLFLLHQKGVVLCRNNRKTDTTCFFILIARCDPLHNYSHPSVGHLGRVSVQGTVKQIQADRYGNDSRRRVVFGRGGGIVKSLKRVSERNHGGGGGCQCRPNHQKQGNIAAMQEQRSWQEFVFFFFVLLILISTHPHSLYPLHTQIHPPLSSFSLLPSARTFVSIHTFLFLISNLFLSVFFVSS